jgi:hypothetical protein
MGLTKKQKKDIDLIAKRYVDRNFSKLSKRYSTIGPVKKRDKMKYNVKQAIKKSIKKRHKKKRGKMLEAGVWHNKKK